MQEKVTILLSVYKPNLDWLNQLLISLNNQTYKNLELIVCNDCPDFPVNHDILDCTITNFKYDLFVNKQNLGSNKAFELLTSLATGDYIAYCDQDDIWHPNKIEFLVKALKATNSVLAFSDMYVIDENGNKTADSISQIRKRQKCFDDSNLTKTFLVRNFISGCSMLIKADIAKKAIPFSNHLIHDHWLVLYASTKGSIKFVDKALIGYRQHSNNQTSVLMNVETKNDYYNIRIKQQATTLKELKNLFINDTKTIDLINKALCWCEARDKWWKKSNISALLTLIKLKNIFKSVTLFEIVMARMPSFVFKYAITQIKSGKI